MHAAEIVFALICAVAALVVAAKKVALPYPVVLVLAGLGLGFVPGLPRVRLDPDLVFFFFLPPLIYPAALSTSWRDFRANFPLILLLATGLVLATTFGVAWIAHRFVPALPWAAAFALGAIVSPTDAVAATTVIRRLAISHRIEAIIEGESLVNDATGLVLLQFAVAALMTGTFSAPTAALQFAVVSVGGVVAGLAVGVLNRLIQRRLDDPPVQITISLLTPFAAYLLAENLHISGVLATVAAGMFVGWHSPVTITARTRLQAVAFWEMIPFLLNGIVFILVGLQLPVILHALHGGETFATLAVYAVAVCGAVIGVRIAWVCAATYLSRVLVREWCEFIPPFRETLLIAWAGMRGVISLAAAFALPLALPNGQPFPGREYILFLTFCVIFVTLVLQGLSLPVVIRWLGMTRDTHTDDEERQARVAANTAALELINQTIARRDAPEDIAARLRAEYDERLQQLENGAANSDDAGGGLVTGDYQRLQHRALAVERNTIIELRNQHVINDEALRRIQRDLDLAEARLTGA